MDKKQKFAHSSKKNMEGRVCEAFENKQIMKYLWLVDLLRARRCALREIQKQWEEDCMGDRKGFQKMLLPRTFYSYLAAIEALFALDIRCENKKYFIDEDDLEDLDADKLKSRVMAMASALNNVEINSYVQQRIIHENMSSGTDSLLSLLEAMRMDWVVRITYKEYGEDVERQYQIQPYYIKAIKRRWYVIAKRHAIKDVTEEGGIKNRERASLNNFMVFAIDCIQQCEVTKIIFRERSFSIDKFFKGCCGSIHDEPEICTVKIRTRSATTDRVISLPLHESQTMLEEEYSKQPEWTYFKLKIRPNLDFFQEMLLLGEDAEIVSPLEVREEMKRHLASISARYSVDPRY